LLFVNKESKFVYFVYTYGSYDKNFDIFENFDFLEATFCDPTTSVAGSFSDPDPCGSARY